MIGSLKEGNYMNSAILKLVTIESPKNTLSHEDNRLMFELLISAANRLEDQEIDQFIERIINLNIFQDIK